MDNNAISYQRVNRALLYILGQWPHQSILSKRICYCIVFFFTMTHGYFQTAGMFAALVEPDVFLEAIPTVLADVVCLVKMVNFTINASKMKKLLITVEEDWKIYTSDAENYILNEWARFGRKVTIYYAGALYGTMVPMMMVPLVPLVLDVVTPMNESYPKHLMFPQIEYLLDFEKHYFPLVIHSYLGTFYYLTIIIAIDTMFMVYIQHACAKFIILGLYLGQLANNIDRDIDRQRTEYDEVDYKHMVQCLVSHNHAIEFSNLIEESNYVSFVVVVGINMLMMTTSMFVAVIKMDNPDVASKFVFFTIGEMFHLFYSSWQGELLLEHSGNTFSNAYHSKWEKTSVRSQQLMIPLLARSAKPCKLTAGKVYVLSIRSFSEVVKTSFSYLTVFTSMRT